MKKKLSKTVLNDFIYPFIIAFLVSSSIIQGSIVPTPSMVGTIKVGDHIFFNRLAYDFYSPKNIPWTNIRLPHFQIPLNDGPERGDIVAFEFPGYQHEFISDSVSTWVKRCVGLPGDTIEIVNRVLFVNGKEFPRPTNINYINENSIPKGFSESDIFPKNSLWNRDNYGPIVIPQKGEVVQLNEKNIDLWETLINRECGSFAVSKLSDKIFINGKETEKYIVQEDQFFMLGDNRDRSADSRFWGYVPRKNIVGTPIIVFWSWNTDIPFSDFFSRLASIKFNRIGKLL